MNIETLLPFEHIVLGLEATTKEEVVRQLAKNISNGRNRSIRK